jgi:Adenylate kinase and related kinases
VGPPGSNVREISLQLADYLGFACTSVGDLLNKEVSKKTEVGKKIEECQQQLKYVPDDIVIDLVKKYLSTLEKEKKSCIIEGFPKTKVQGLNLQRAGIIPDCFLLLNLPEDKIVHCVQYAYFVFF